MALLAVLSSLLIVFFFFTCTGVRYAQERHTAAVAKTGAGHHRWHPLLQRPNSTHAPLFCLYTAVVCVVRSLLNDSAVCCVCAVCRACVVPLVWCGAVGAASEGRASNMESRHRGGGQPGGLAQRAEGSDGHRRRHRHQLPGTQSKQSTRHSPRLRLHIAHRIYTTHSLPLHSPSIIHSIIHAHARGSCGVIAPSC